MNCSYLVPYLQSPFCPDLVSGCLGLLHMVVIECWLFCLCSLSSRLFNLLPFTVNIFPLFNLLNSSSLMGSIWSQVDCEIGSGDVFILILTFFRDVIVVTRDDRVNCSTSIMANVVFFSLHLELDSLISVLLRGCD